MFGLFGNAVMIWLVIVLLFQNFNYCVGENARDVLLSAMESESISARSKKTRHRSLRTWIRGLISRYSRTAM